MTVAGGRCLATFKHVDHARDRAEALIAEGRVERCWLRDRSTDVFAEFRR